jgi:hypothetical protein
MASNKTTVNRNSVTKGLLLVGTGFTIGVIVQDVPFVKLKMEADLGAVIAILGLIATAFYLPNVVERKFKKKDTINEVVRSDIESIINEVELLKAVYRKIGPTTKIKQTTYTEILGLFKSISADILALNVQLSSRNKLPDFKNDVYVEKYIPTKEVCTNDLVTNKLLSTEIAADAISELDKLTAELRKYRYETFSEN